MINENDVYGKLYNNEAYVALASAIAKKMGVQDAFSPIDLEYREYLEIMLAIQDKALAAARGEYKALPPYANVVYSFGIEKLYIEFSLPFWQYLYKTTNA